MDNHFQPLNIQSHIHLQNLWDHRTILFINIIIITLLPLLWPVLWMIKPRLLTISCVLITVCLFFFPELYSFFLLISTGLVGFCVVLCTIYKRDKSWKIAFNFIRGSEPFCNVVYFLRYRYALSYQGFNLLDISMHMLLWSR